MTNNNRQTAIILSGGLDSTTLLYHLLDAGHSVKAVSFNYGQRHSKELAAATDVASLVNVEFKIVDISGLATIFGQNALTNPSVDVPHGAYVPATMSVTTVPNRNMIMLSIATGWAISLGFDSVAFGAHGGEYTPYPDCQPQFARAMNEATKVCDNRPIEVLAPFVDWDKSQIVKRGNELRVPFEKTWSCYEGGEFHCGRCATCFDRRSAFSKAGLTDPVRYSPSS